MCAVMLIFAVLMSMVINLVEQMIIHDNRKTSIEQEQDQEHAFTARRSE